MILISADIAIDIISLILLIVAVMLILKITPGDLINLRKDKEASVNIKEVQKRKLENIIGRKLNIFEKFRNESVEVLKQGNFKISYKVYVNIVVACSAIGFIFGLAVNNVLLSFVLSIGFMFAPITFLKLKQYKRTKMTNEQLKTNLDIITNAYRLNENTDIVKAVKNNMNRIEEPMFSILEQFVYEVEHVNPDRTKAILNMKYKINNKLYHQWCDLLIKCQKNRNLKHGLKIYIDKMSGTKIIQAQVDTTIYKPVKDHVIASIVSIGIIPFYKLMDAELYFLLVGTIPGKIIVSSACGVILGMAAYVVKVSKPISLY